MTLLIPGIAGLMGVLVMTLLLRRARYLWLPETQMIRAIGSVLTKDAEHALMPGFVVHTTVGVVFAYIYYLFLSTAPALPEGGKGIAVMMVVCGVMGLVHGLIVTLFLVISVAQYHPVAEFRKLEPGDMASHVLGHLGYGLTVGFCLSWLPMVM